jgi:hypothetical protein
MAKPLVTAKGLDGATSIALMLDVLTTANAGADWVSEPRKPYRWSSAKNTPTNKELIRYLAGVDAFGRPDPLHKGPRRDIRPTDKDRQRSAELFSNELVKQMRKVGLIANGKAITVERSAKAGIVGGLRKAAKHLAKAQYENLKSGNFTAPEEQWANKRNAEWGVAKSVSLIASRQLSEALQEGKIKINYKTRNLGKIRSLVNRASS